MGQGRVEKRAPDFVFGVVKGGASGAESAPFEVFLEVVGRVNRCAAMVRFGAAVVRLGAAAVRLGAGKAHHRAVAENEQKRANGLFWPFFGAFC